MLLLIVTSEKKCSSISINYFRSADEIEFRDIKNLSQILFNYSDKSHRPNMLCAVSPTVLVYVDRSKYKDQFHWLDCSDTEPKLLGITANTNVSIYDMCIAEYGNEKLLITLPNKECNPIDAYDSATGQLKWTAEKKVPSTGEIFHSCGMTTDDLGRILIGDTTQKCIQMFSVSDGKYLGCWMKMRDLGLNLVRSLQRCETTSHLVVADEKDNKIFINVLN